jgi:hypothetical protein
MATLLHAFIHHVDIESKYGFALPTLMQILFCLGSNL